MIKRLIILLVILMIPLGLGLLFTYDVIKLQWVGTMHIQPSYQPQEDPLPMPARSIPRQGAAYIAGLGAPVNPVPADEVSLGRGEQLFKTFCAVCHGQAADGKGSIVANFFTTYKPANLLQGNALTGSDGSIFMTLTNGINGRMPAMRDDLPGVRERWDIVNYIRKLQKSAP
jgi:mono/diheme cytochrome c family protein